MCLHGANLALGYPGNPWGDNHYVGNLSQHCGGGEISFYFSQAPTDKGYVYNNTVVADGSGDYAIGDAGSGDTVAGVTVVADNILIAGNGAKLVNFTNPATTSLLGNDYWTYNGVATTYTWNGTTYTSFSAFQTATSAEKIGGVNVGLTVNPQIYSPGGGFTNGGYVPANLMAYNLQSGSPMIGAGQSYSAVGITPVTSLDYFGVTINPAAPPVGAAAGDFATFAASCTAASNYLARVSSFLKADNVIYNGFLCGENTDGNLSQLDGQWITGPNHAAFLLNLVSSNFSLTEHGTCGYTARVGLVGASGCYEDTGLNPTSAGGQYSANFAHTSAYMIANASENGSALIGAVNAGTIETSLFPAVAGGLFYDVNNALGGGPLSGPSLGFWLNNRPSSAGTILYLNQAISTNKSGSDATAGNVAENFYLMTENVAGTPGTSSVDTVAEWSIGGSGTGFNAVVFSQRVNSLMMSYNNNKF